LGPPLGDQRLDLWRPLRVHLAGRSGADRHHPQRDPLADALNPDAIYRLAIDNDGDLQNDIAFSYVFSEPKDGKQTVDVYLAANEDAESAEAVGEKIFSPCPFHSSASSRIIATSGDFTSSPAPAATRFFFDFDGVKNLFDTSGGRNFTALTLPGESPWTGVDSQHPSQRLLSPPSRCRPAPWAPTPTSEIWVGAACACDGEPAPRRPRRSPLGQQLLQHR